MFSIPYTKFNMQHVISKVHLSSFRKSLGELAIFSRTSILSLMLFGITVPNVQADIPKAAFDDDLFKQGYLNIMHYGVPSASAADNTARINQAIKDAYNRNNDTKIMDEQIQIGTLNGSLALYFPAGTYVVNDTLKAHTDTDTDTDSNNFDKPGNHLTIVGSTIGSRPKIKLALNNNNGFDNASAPKALLEFKNGALDANGNVITENANQGYNQMLRGVDLECNSYSSGYNQGCIALYFMGAQNSSVENVNINVTSAHTGIRGAPGSAGGIFNVTINGGRIGIDTDGGELPENSPRPGVVLAGITLKNQTEHSVKHNGIAPLTIVGFEIVTPTSTETIKRAALQTQNGFNDATAASINLIDGVIRLSEVPTVAAIDNTQGRNFYTRNVYITTMNNFSGNSLNVVKSGTNSNTRDATRKRIVEYSYTMPAGPGDPLSNPGYRVSQNLINGVTNSTQEYTTNIVDSAPAVPTDIVTRHVWARLPSVDDTDAYDVRNGGIDPGIGFAPIAVDAGDLQGIIDNHQKVFLPKGIYKLDGPITLRENTVLYGAGRGLTRIEADLSYWANDPTTETAVIKTDNLTTATTYIGNLSIGVDVSNIDHDYFTALQWRAGASSMVHMGQVYRTSTVTRETTQPHNLIKIMDNGGGRWYFTGSIKTKTSQDPNNLNNGSYRILKVVNTSQPLWFYALNPEHPRGVDTFMEFNNADNVRIYGLKSEYNGEGTTNPLYVDKSSVLKFTNGSSNVAVFGHSSLRYGLFNDKGAVEFIDTTPALATLIAPQAYLNKGNTPTARTVKETTSNTVYKIDFPNIVTVYKKGTIGDTEDGVMVHTNPSY